MNPLLRCFAFTTRITCRICGLDFASENMQAIFEHKCFICRDCIGLVFKPFVFIPNHEIERRRKKLKGTGGTLNGK